MAPAQVIAIPVKPLERAKTRLAPVLAPDERARLTLAMFRDVLEACVGQPPWDVWVVSRDPAVLALATDRGARPVVEEGSTLLAAMRQLALLTRDGAALTVALADLPFVTRDSLAEVLEVPGPVVAVPAESDGGTNLLLRRPPSGIRARFGRSSFARHRAEAYGAGLTFGVVRSAQLGFDLDRPDDLERVLAGPAAPRTRQACLDMSLAERLRVRA